ncbi:MAG: hypothetical protein IJF92_04760 [Bacilli bacterium]|nr:hypothetical protein [Bacilli bacterium]
MLKIEYLQELLLVSIILSTISCTFVQKTKILFKNSKYLNLYSFIINILLSILFCYNFTSIGLISSIWVGLFSYLGADSIYKTLEGKIPSHNDLVINRK